MIHRKPRVQRTVRRLLGERRGDLRPDHPPGRRASDREPKRGWVPSMVIAALIALADWGTKAAVAAAVPLDGFREIVDGRVALWHVHNHAMILGLWSDVSLGGRQAIAACAAVVGSLVLVQVVGRGHRLTRRERPWAWVFVGLVMGGMLGNLGERAIHWWVTDFLSFRWGDVWLPPGNVADVALFLSVPMALPVIVFELLGRTRRGRAPLADAAAAD